MTTANASDSAQGGNQELIKGLGGEYIFPDLNDVAKYTPAKCAQLADELRDKGLIETISSGFCKLSLPEKRETLMKVLQALGGAFVDHDPILEFASHIEKVNTRAEIEE